MKTSKPKVLFYDIETTPLQAWVWRCGKQVVLPGQLVDTANEYNVICICYEWLDSPKRGKLVWNQKTQNSRAIIKEFTKLCDEADLIIGKNNKRFDDKHMNTQRLLHGLDGRPDLLEKVDDLETQMRRHFALPSFGLDYFSHSLGFGGKDKMRFDDWISIMLNNKGAKKALNKMVKYCSKDVSDTKRIWKHCVKHFRPKYNMSTHNNVLHELKCSSCGSADIIKNGTRQIGSVKYQNYFCKEHGGYAGKRNLNSKKLTLRS